MGFGTSDMRPVYRSRARFGIRDGVDTPEFEKDVCNGNKNLLGITGNGIRAGVAT